MKKILFSLFILLAVNSQAQFIYPTESAWMFLSGIYGGNYGNLHISADGDIDTIKGNAYDFPDSLRVASAGSRYYLTGVLSGGQYDLDWRRPTKADISALTVDQVLYGASDGSIEQSADAVINTNAFGVYGLHISGETGDRTGITINGGSVQPSNLYLESDGTNQQIFFFDNSNFENWSITRVPTSGDLEIVPSSEKKLGLMATPLQDLHILADTIRFEGLDGTGTYLGIDVNGDVTRTTVTGFGDVSKVGTPVNNQIGVWTGDGTIEGEASLTYDATAGFDLANSFDAQWSTTGSGTLITGNLSNASATGKIIDLQHDEVTKFQVTYTGSTVISKTSVDAVHALKAGQLGVGATGDVFQMANASGNTTTFTVDGKIDLYATEVPANGEILIGDGTDMELATITAGSGITVSNGAGSITIAETNEAATTYTPTAANVTNVASIGTVYGHYYRDGDMVHVFVYTTAAATGSAALTEMSVTLPVASNFANTYDCMGNGTVLSSANANGFSGRVFGSVAGDVAVFAWRPTSTATLEINFNFSYKIL